MARKGEGLAIGIDLGTNYSCVAVWQNGRVEIIANDIGNTTTPSYVAFTDSKRLIGDAASNQAAVNPINTVFNSKRLIGRKFSDPSVQSYMKFWPFKIISGPADKPMIVVDYKGEEKQFVAEEIEKKVTDNNKFYLVLSRVLSKGSELDAYYFYMSMILSFIKRPKENTLPKPALTSLFQAIVRMVECSTTDG